MKEQEIKISELRAEVIEKAISVESSISIAITHHYFGKLNSLFLLEVMYDEYFTTGLKINILKKAFPTEIKGIEEKLRRLMKIRNAFAHNHNFMIAKGGKLYTVNPAKFDRNSVKQPPENIAFDFPKMHKEFIKLLNEVNPILKKLAPRTP